MYHLKIYNKNYELLDEIYDFSNLRYTVGLNTKSTCSFSVPLNSPKSTPDNLEFNNIIEVYNGDNKIFEGLLVERYFNSADIEINCYCFLHIFSKRRFPRTKDYSGTVDKVITKILDDLNAEYDTGIVIGNVEKCNTHTTRTVYNTDIVYDKIIEYLNDSNTYIDIKDRKLNFYNKKGSETDYVLQYTLNQEGDNVIKLPSLTQSILDTENDVFSSITYQENDATPETVDDEIYDDEIVETDKEITITSLKRDIGSINQYGLMQGVYSTNSSIRLQSTLDEYTQNHLVKYSLPHANINIDAVDTFHCPMNKINVGDTINLILEPYFNFQSRVRIINLEFDMNTQIYKITLGQILLKRNAPKINVYTR